ncbi:MAG: putative O-glycosylation ligase, exosortase A system-associated [Planctomycetes bacterium]|nr:putative O-glycosylation ligase, exosortase A system-associated [Planctomycetota bacterium]
MRDLLVMAIVLLSLPLTLRRPFVGLLVFSWLAYMRPQDLCWGFARNLRLSLFVALLMILGWFIHEQGRRPFARWDVRTGAMTVLAGLVAISYAFAQRQDAYTNSYFVEYLKIIAIALFTTSQVDSKQRLRVILWTIALSLGFFGVKNGVFGILRGGGQITRGPGGMLEDNNDFALAMVMNVPLLWYLGLAEGKKWVRQATLVALFLTVVVILLTHSRGAFLALCMSMLWIAWRSGKLLRAVLVLGFLAALFPVVAPDAVLERLSTIGDTKESSANARLTAWATALRMIQANPGLGVGMRNFQTRFLDYSLEPGKVGHTYVAHNSYLQIWAESGTPAFLVYLVLLGSVFLACRKVLRMSDGRPDLAWAGFYARMMETTTVGFMVGAFFLNRGHFDLVYHWLALVSCLAMVARSAWQSAPEFAVARDRVRHISVRFARPWGAGQGAVLPGGTIATPRWR